ncbi:MAG TPA: GAF domain-containing protein, partial [Candidatus Ozemobacteraceae bacterium]|nr:GAF domain-containing protein [Candidatus Ozemobacteraceae bacterium]
DDCTVALNALMELAVNLSVYVFIGNAFLLLGLATSWIVAVSVTRPLARIRSKLETFLEKRVANPVNDIGDDEIAEIASDVSRVFSIWNGEISLISKKQRQRNDDAVKSDAARSDIEHQLELTRSCLKVAQSLNTTFDFQNNLKTILDEAVRTMNIQWASILLLNRDSLELTVACMRGMEQSLLDDLAEDKYPAIKLKPNEGLAGQVIKGGLPLLANKGHKDPRFRSFTEFKAREEKVASILCAPIKASDGTILGVINFINRISPPLFRNEDIPFAQDIAMLSALVIERNRLYRNLFCDDATGMISHRIWKGYFEEEAARSVRYAQPLCTVVMDLEKYKEIQEQTAPEFALQVGNDVAKAVQKALRDTDLASRAHDRFYILLPNTDAAGGVFLIGRLKDALERMTFEYGGRVYNLGASA